MVNERGSFAKDAEVADAKGKYRYSCIGERIICMGS